MNEGQAQKRVAEPAERGECSVPNDSCPGEGRTFRVAAFSLLGIILLFSLTICALLARQAFRPRGTPTTVRPPAPRYSHLDDKVVGAGDAKVRVLAVLPLRTGCQNERIDYLLSAAKAYPDKLRVHFLDIKGPRDRKAFQEHKIECASVVVNGSAEFEIQTASGTRNVVLKGPPSERGYTLADLQAVLQLRLEEAYGDAAPRLPAPSDTSAGK